MAWHEAEKLRDHPMVQAYLEDLDDFQRLVCEHVRTHLKRDPEVTEFIAWGVPCYWRHGPLMYTSAAKAHVTLGFFRGMEIGAGLKGTGRSPVAKWVVKKATGIPAEFDGWVARAFELDAADEARV